MIFEEFFMFFTMPNYFKTDDSINAEAEITSRINTRGDLCKNRQKQWDRHLACPVSLGISWNTTGETPVPLEDLPVKTAWHDAPVEFSR
jgi:hypothetical protein